MIYSTNCIHPVNYFADYRKLTKIEQEQARHVISAFEKEVIEKESQEDQETKADKSLDNSTANAFSVITNLNPSEKVMGFINQYFKLFGWDHVSYEQKQGVSNCLIFHLK